VSTSGRRVIVCAVTGASPAALRELRGSVLAPAADHRQVRRRNTRAEGSFALLAASEPLAAGARSPTERGPTRRRCVDCGV